MPLQADQDTILVLEHVLKPLYLHAHINNDQNYHKNVYYLNVLFYKWLLNRLCKSISFLFTCYKGTYNGRLFLVSVMTVFQKTPQLNQETGASSCRAATTLSRAPMRNRRPRLRCTGSSPRGDGAFGSHAGRSRVRSSNRFGARGSFPRQIHLHLHISLSVPTHFPKSISTLVSNF
jgi:hypothetical protein